ncbi:MAG TPA: ATP-binding cassette domain-containing protein [Gemmatimonadales bacterium]|jgi:iron complex transport system ATP-binding protein
MLELKQVTYRVGRVTILDDVSLAFAPARFNVILGPNGAGKSTLLRAAAGVLRPTSGEVRYDGADARQLSSQALARRRAVLSQRLAIAFPLPVEDVVLLGRYPYYSQLPSARDREIVTEALALVGMAERRMQSYDTLSGGEQQKVQLARVLAQIWPGEAGDGERYLFLDEPTSNLDIRYQLQILQVARGLLASQVTVIAVLHDFNSALRHGDAFYLLDQGRLVHQTTDAATITEALVDQTFGVRSNRVDLDHWTFEL